MKTYVAYYGKNCHTGSLLSVIYWAGQEATKRKVDVVIARFRAGTKLGQPIIKVSPTGLITPVKGRSADLKGLSLE